MNQSLSTTRADLVRSTLRRDDRAFRRPKGALALADPYLAALTRSPREWATETISGTNSGLSEL